MSEGSRAEQDGENIHIQMDAVAKKKEDNEQKRSPQACVLDSEAEAYASRNAKNFSGKSQLEDKMSSHCLKMAFTEADIAAKRHELEQMREETHKRQIEELDAKIQEMEEKKAEVERQGRQKLHELFVQRQGLENELRQKLEEQEEDIMKFKQSQADEIAGYKEKLADLQKNLVDERNGLVHKQGLIAELVALKNDEEHQHAKDQETLKKLIEEEEASLQRMKQAHEELKEKNKMESELRMQAFNREKESLVNKIAKVKEGSENKTQDFQAKHANLLATRDQLQKDLDAEKNERDNKLKPLRKQKQDLSDQILSMQDKIRNARAKEEQKTENIINQYEERYSKTQQDFDKEREEEIKRIFEKECNLKDKELELDKLRGDNEQKLKEIEREMNQKLKDMTSEIEEQEENNRKQLQQVVDKEKFRELEEQIHHKTCELQNLEANQQAEEALLKVWLEAVTDKERYLREELAAKVARYSNKISTLDNDLSAAKQQAENEQRQHDALKDETERKLQEKRDEFESQTRDAASHLNDLNNQIAELKRSLKIREDAAKDRGETIERRIGEETRRLQKLKSDLEEQLGPLRERHNDLKQKVSEEKEKHQKNLEVLQKEQSKQNHDQEDELSRLYALLEGVRDQFKDERQQLQSALKEILDSNDRLREKHEKEIFDLNMKLVQTLQATSEQGIDATTTRDLQNKVKELEEEYDRKSKSYNATLNRMSQEKDETNQKCDDEIRKMKEELRKLSQEYMKDGTKNPSERVEKLREMLENKTRELEKAKASTFSRTVNQVHLMDEVEEAKKHQKNLIGKLQDKKKELSDLMRQRRKEIEDLSKRMMERDADAEKSNAEFDTGPLSSGTPKERLDKLASLRALIEAEMRERKKLLNEIARLQQELPKNQDAAQLTAGSNAGENIHIQLDELVAPRERENKKSINRCVLDEGTGDESAGPSEGEDEIKKDSKNISDEGSSETTSSAAGSESERIKSGKPDSGGGTPGAVASSGKSALPASKKLYATAPGNSDVDNEDDTSKNAMVNLASGTPGTATTGGKESSSAGATVPTRCVAPMDYILELIAEKENELDELNLPDLPQENENAERLKLELEALRHQLPMDHENRSCKIQSPAASSAGQNVSKMSKKEKRKSSKTKNSVRFLDKNFDQTSESKKSNPSPQEDEENSNTPYVNSSPGPAQEYLFFMENEEDEASAYHPHDLNRYCQFCLDQLHPNVVERPFTVNPVIPLLDDIYDHVLKKYPKRSFCILRNCVKVSELLSAVESNVYELVRRDNMSDYVTLEAEAAVGAEAVFTEEQDPLYLGTCEAAAESDQTTGQGPRRRSVRILRSRTKNHSGEPTTKAVKSIPKRAKTVSDNPAPDSIDSKRRSKRISEKEQRKGGSDLTEEPVRPSASSTDTSSSFPKQVQTVKETRSLLEPPEDFVSSRVSKTTEDVPSSVCVMTRSRKRRIEEQGKKGGEEKRPKLASYSLRSSRHGASSSRNCRENQEETQEMESRRMSTRSSTAAAASAAAASKAEQHQSSLPAPGGPSALRPCGSGEDVTATLSFEKWEKQNIRCLCASEAPCSSSQPDGARSSSSSSSSPPAGDDDPLHQTLLGHRARCKSMQRWNYEADWVEPEFVQYRQITGWPHLNECVRTLEVLNIGGTNVLGEFIPFVLLNCPRLKSLGQWLNTTIYGLEILRKLPGRERATFESLVEFSYSTDRNYFCQPYIGFVPESKDFANVRREMIRMSGKISRKVSHSRKVDVKRAQVREDADLIVNTCPRIRKLNLVVHYKNLVLEDDAPQADDPQDGQQQQQQEPASSLANCPWNPLSRLLDLCELDLVTMRFANVRSLLRVVGARLSSLTLEMADEQGVGSEIVHLGRTCPNLRTLKLILGDNVLHGEMTLHFGSQFFRQLEHLTVEGSVHLHAFAFLWGHCRRLRYMRIGLVVSHELTNTNMLIHDVFTLLFQVNAMSELEEFHVRNLKIRSLAMGKFLLDSLPRLRSASNWLLDLNGGGEVARFKDHLQPFVDRRGLKLDYRLW